MGKSLSTNLRGALPLQSLFEEIISWRFQRIGGLWPLVPVLFTPGRLQTTRASTTVRLVIFDMYRSTQRVEEKV